MLLMSFFASRCPDATPVDRPQPPGRAGFSLIEVVAAVALLALIVAISIPFLSKPSEDVKQNTCYMNKGEIEVQAQLWFRNKGNWPAADLRDIGSDRRYFPDGLPTCPEDGSSYRLNRRTGKVVGHTH